MVDHNSNHTDTRGHQIKALVPWTRLIVPITAVAAIVLALLPIPAATCQEVCQFSILKRFTLTGATCFVLGFALFSYWAAKDSRNDLLAIWRQFVSLGLRLNPKVAELLTQGMIIVLKSLKERAITMASNRAHAKGRTEGRAETKAEFQSWLKRQQEAGTIVYDESDPPPD